MGGGGYGFGAVQEFLNRAPLSWIPLVINQLVDYADYFIDDVMLMDPIFFDKNFEKILDGCKFIYENKYPYIEQDVLNYLFSKIYLKLPLKFDTIVRNQRQFFKEKRIEKAIYHFAGEKPDLNTDDIYNKLYFDYFLKTPYATSDMFKNIGDFCDKFFSQTNNKYKDLLLHFTNLVTQRERAFFVYKNNWDVARKIFVVKENELFIEASESNALENLINSMKETKGNVIYFILVSNYQAVQTYLIQSGFIENQDFVNGTMFLSEKYGIKINFDSRKLLYEI